MNRITVNRKQLYGLLALVTTTIALLLTGRSAPVTMLNTPSPQRGLAGGGQYTSLLSASWWYNWGVWSEANCDTRFVPLVPSYYTYLDQATWERKIKARTVCAPGTYWLVGNEPDVPGRDSDGGHQADFDLLMQSYNWAIATIHQNDPSAKVIVGGFVNKDVDFANRMKAAITEPVSGWHFHLYDYPDLDGFRDAMNWFISWSNGEAWLTEWGVLVGSGQLDWMRQTLPIVQASGLNRYAWFKTTPNGWEATPVNLVDAGGNLTELGQIYAGYTVIPTIPPPTAVAVIAVVEAENADRHGAMTTVRSTQYSACQAVQLTGGNIRLHIDAEQGYHKLYLLGYGDDWGSDSVFVTVGSGEQLTVDLQHALTWTPIGDRGEWNGRDFYSNGGDGFDVLIETRERGAVVDAVVADKPRSAICQATPYPTITHIIPTATPPLAATYAPPMPTPTALPLTDRVATLEAQVAELQARQAELWEIVTGGQ